MGEIELDRCPMGHGLWFDRSELTRLVSSHLDDEEEAVARFFGEFDRASSKEGGA